MRAITPVFSVLLIIVLSVAVVGFLWLFVTGTFNTLTSTGTSTVDESLVTISSCMKIESVYGNQVSIRNCGKGVISQDTLKVYLDNVPLDISANYFGNKNVGAEENGYPGDDLGGSSYMGGSKFIMPQDGIIKMISAYVYQYDRASNAKALIYSDNNGVPGNLLASSNTVALQTSPRWEDFVINYLGKANTPYWLVIFSSTGHHISYDTGYVNQQAYSWGNTWPTIPNPFAVNYGPGYHDYAESIYASYMLVINEGETGTVTLSGLWNFNLGGHLLRVTNPKVITEKPVEAVLPDSNVLDLEFDEGEGTITYDKSGYGNNGVLGDNSCLIPVENCPDWIDGKYGYGLNFDGSDDYVQVPNSSIFQGGTMKTLEAWVSPSSVSARQIIIEKGDTNLGGAERGPYFLAICEDGRVVIAAWDDSTTPKINAFTGTSVLSANNWYHLVLVIDTTEPDATSETKLYINGIQETRGSNVCSGNELGDLGAIRSNTQPLLIGIRDSAGIKSIPFKGIIDSVRIYNKALTPDETIILKTVSYD